MIIVTNIRYLICNILFLLLTKYHYWSYFVVHGSRTVILIFLKLSKRKEKKKKKSLDFCKGVGVGRNPMINEDFVGRNFLEIHTHHPHTCKWRSNSKPLIYISTINFFFILSIRWSIVAYSKFGRRLTRFQQYVKILLGIPMFEL